MTTNNPHEDFAQTILAQTDKLAKLKFDPESPEYELQQGMMRGAEIYRHSKLLDDKWQEGFDFAVKTFRTILDEADPTALVADIRDALDSELELQATDG